MDLNLSGKRVLVTGGSKGIGLACAEAFAAEGALPILVSRDAAALETAAAGIRERHGVAVETMAADLANGEARERLAAALPDIDVLVNNAGAIPGGSVLDLGMAEWEAAWQLKVFGYIHMTKLFVEAMRERGGGTIVNVIGMMGMTPRWDYACGSAGNAALIAFTQAVGARSTDWNVRVFGVNPSATRTDRIAAVYRKRAKTRFDDEERWAEALGDLPFGRLAEPTEIASLVTLLASPRVAYLSGSVVDMDGGGRFR
ncbi:SDR family NAD(P)-dependent oxidoreductase (plasmid) [Azospirillum brasilense]|uniref:SDR family NAD(P)-dependent oxidoreductase n=2 Tax=Azospirillum brasilense TaxID=192 RepID=A0A4D8QVS4_AZOBR|nr:MULTISPECIES: short-chain dehydrogenase/reductase [Azospirillum]MDW7556750.1 short-chain dehydrogenase/reductase [Azospirillum brasilense]MDW7596921.1 short-chain dehydrogenase/reductase [Azospirillum brasilense]MDW7631424.1 short-chain dehydrogenase/reductase [Azospirillum brasilense]MDX5949898.1 short-chain dehydrogenase/reductase [Azospirillum brasilense]OPH13836.1 short-chain dehydrogenase [Azospirillum brasilense]